MTWQDQKEPEWWTGPKDWTVIEAQEEKEARLFPAGLRNSILWRRQALEENWPSVQNQSGRYHVERMLHILESIAQRLGIKV